MYNSVADIFVRNCRLHVDIRAAKSPIRNDNRREPRFILLDFRMMINAIEWTPVIPTIATRPGLCLG
jgi:hypothetical protein